MVEVHDITCHLTMPVVIELNFVSVDAVAVVAFVQKKSLNRKFMNRVETKKEL